MRKVLIGLLGLVLIPSLCFAGTVSRHTTYTTNSTVTATNLNGNFDNIVTAVNGGLENDNIKAGAILSYADTSIDSKNRNQKIDANSYQLSLYRSGDLGKFYTNALAGFSLNQYVSSRTIATASEVATADFYGQTYLARFGAGYKKDVGNGFLIIPNTSITYARDYINSYSESGAGTLNLNVRNEDLNKLEGSLGLKINYLHESENGICYIPELRISYGYDFIHDIQRSGSTFIGTSPTFISKGIDNGRDSFAFGTGIDIIKSNKITLSADYDYEMKNKYSNHSASIKLKYAFD